MHNPAFEEFRKAFADLPFAIVELLITNVVVGNMTMYIINRIADTIRLKMIRACANVNGDGI